MPTRETSVKTLHFPLSAEILEALRVEWRNSTLRFISIPEPGNENIHLNKYFMSSSGDRTHKQSILQSHFGPLRHDWPITYVHAHIRNALTDLSYVFPIVFWHTSLTIGFFLY